MNRSRLIYQASINTRLRTTSLGLSKAQLCLRLLVAFQIQQSVVKAAKSNQRVMKKGYVDTFRQLASVLKRDAAGQRLWYANLPGNQSLPNEETP
jgi:hypothetical protein